MGRGKEREILSGGERFTAAAVACLVRVFEGEAGFKFTIVIIHFGADQVQHRALINEDFKAFVFNHFFSWILLGRVFHEVAHAGATAGLNADSQT